MAVKKSGRKKLKRIIGFLLALVLLTMLFQNPGWNAVVLAKESFEDYKLIASNSAYNLYMREEDLSLIVEDKSTGAYMESAPSYDDGKSNAVWLGAMKSAVVLTLINKNDDTKQADLLNDAVTKKIDYTSDGFTAKLYWTKYKLGMTLEVGLGEDGLISRIPDDSIQEDGTAYQIGTISMYPYMGTSYLDDKEGYLFLPDGNGALIYLNDKEGHFKSGFSSMIYGDDPGFEESTAASLLWDKYETVTDSEKVIAPVYGIAHTADGIAYLAIVEEGAMRASIEAHPNGVSVDYNRAYAKFVERKLYTQPTSNSSSVGSFKLAEAERAHSDLQVRFLFLGGERANYAGMANAYREYLLKQGLLQKQADSYKTRIDFLGGERESFLLGTTGVTMTTVEDIREIYEDLMEQGITDTFTVYKGWQKGGLYNIPISAFKTDGSLGGNGNLVKLMNETKAAGNELYLYSDALRINPDEKNATFNVVKKINKRRYEEKTYKDVYETFVYLTPARSQLLTEKLIKSMQSKKVEDICLAGISNILFSYTYSGDTYTRYETGETYKSTADKVAESMNLVLEQPFAYLWSDTKAFLDMPLYTSNYIYEDESVPFLSIVLKGVMPVYSEYVNFEANKQEFFLKMVETGTYPSFYVTRESASELIYTNSNDIYSSEYSVYESTIVKYGKELKELNERLQGAYITGHEILDGGVTRVTYDNGVKIYVNYDSVAKSVDGVSVGAMSYQLVR